MVSKKKHYTSSTPTASHLSYFLEPFEMIALLVARKCVLFHQLVHLLTPPQTVSRKKKEIMSDVRRGSSRNAYYYAAPPFFFPQCCCLGAPLLTSCASSYIVRLNRFAVEVEVAVAVEAEVGRVGLGLGAVIIGDSNKINTTSPTATSTTGRITIPAIISRKKQEAPSSPHSSSYDDYCYPYFLARLL